MAIVAEADIHEGVVIAIPGFTTYYGKPDWKGTVRVLMAVREDLATGTSVLEVATSDIWLQLPTSIVVGGVYRLWRPEEGEGAAACAFKERVSQIAAVYRNIVVAGDFNLDRDRLEDPSYSRKSMVTDLVEEMENLNLVFKGPEVPTYISFGKFKNGEHRRSKIDHVYATIRGTSVSVLTCAASDHLPMLVNIPCADRPASGTLTLTGRNWKRVTREALMAALEPGVLAQVFHAVNVDKAHEIIINEVTRALDTIAPVKTMVVKRRDSPLSLAPDTLRAMEKRDQAAACRCPTFN